MAEKLLEGAANYDDELMEMYLEGQDIPGDKLMLQSVRFVSLWSAAQCFSVLLIRIRGVNPSRLRLCFSCLLHWIHQLSLVSIQIQKRGRGCRKQVRTSLHLLGI